MKVKDIYRFMDEFAPFERAEDFDNCGLIVGDMEQEVTKIGMALDITNEIIDKALDKGINLILTHHPVIFNAMKRICANHPVYRLIRNGISVISAHTNLDKAQFGINTVLAEYYHLQNVASPLCLDDLGRIGNLESPLPVPEYAKLIKASLGAQSVRYLDCGKPVSKGRLYFRLRCRNVPGSDGMRHRYLYYRRSKTGSVYRGQKPRCQPD